MIMEQLIQNNNKTFMDNQQNFEIVNDPPKIHLNNWNDLNISK